MEQLVFNLVVRQMVRSLKGLKSCLVAAKDYAQQRGFSEDSFLALKVAPDMFPFVRQVQIATDNAKGGAARLSGREAPVFADDETTLVALIDRVERTMAYLSEFKPEDFNRYADQVVRFPWSPNFHLTGADFLESHLIPNFYFHYTTAYVLLRDAGVPLGKKEFLGHQNWRKD